MSRSWYVLGIALAASIGTFLYVSTTCKPQMMHTDDRPEGFDTGIATTTIAHESWADYMGHPSNGLTGAVVAVYIAGEAIGAIMQILIADELGRLRFMQLACILVTVGCAIQTAATSIGMFLAGRVLAGIAVGALSATVPIYLSEISAPKTRGLIGGLSGVGLSAGAMTANWVGFAGSYASYGDFQWRLPLGLQLPWGILLFACLSTFMPNSPRQLIQRGKVDDARDEFVKIRGDLHSHEVHEEFVLMKSQIEYEMAREEPTYREIFRTYRRRVLMSVSVQVLTSVTGVNVIQYYQTIQYRSLGIGPRATLSLAAVWATCAFVANAVAINFLPDRWGRRKMLLAGVSCVICTEVYVSIMQHAFQDTDNRVGKGFAIFGIYVFAVCYYSLINSVTWLYGAEILPIPIRSKVMGVAAAAHYIVNVALTEAGPSAFSRVGENYYYVFIGCCVVYLVIIYLYYPETKQKTLEEIAAAFGERMVAIGDQEVDAEGLALEAKGNPDDVS
ncbi:general substrate transporter [Xylariaceae sp. FL0016]|nr:general substrate transporter [Xylariaceae sp. FL0016]